MWSAGFYLTCYLACCGYYGTWIQLNWIEKLYAPWKQVFTDVTICPVCIIQFYLIWLAILISSVSITGSLWRRQSQQSFNTLTPFYFLSHYMFRPLRAILMWDIQLDILRTIFNTADPLHVRNLMYRCYMLYISISTCSPNTCYQIEYKYKNCNIKVFRKKGVPYIKC
jgi:hypothetical protein